MLIKNSRLEQLSLNDATGAIESFRKGGRELIHQDGPPRPLFALRMRDAANTPCDVTAFDARSFDMVRVPHPRADIVELRYRQVGGHAITVTVRVTVPADSAMTRWSLSIQNDTDWYVDHLDFPGVTVPNDLVGAGGDARVFWPTTEGCLIENTAWRTGWLAYRPIEHPVFGWVGMYPACATMQFMAYYGAQGGLYLAAHDAQCNNKGIEWCPTPSGGIELQFRLFPGAPQRGTYTLPYDMILGTFDGDWWDAAEIYRTWVESSTLPRPPKLKDNPRVPKWIDQSPVVVTYPVRGKKDVGDQTPNDYYPYTNALPVLDRLSTEFDSTLMVLLMHWEGSAPWAPPYVWPPYGGQDNFMTFLHELHRRGHQIGVYASGTGYTLRSNTDPAYDRQAEFEAKNLQAVMCEAPDGKLADNGVCCGATAQRIGYDMCPANEWVKEVVVDQVTQIVEHGVDYVQYFDQNLGGNAPRCYSTRHGHPPGSGPWQIAEMRALYHRLQQVTDRMAQKPLIGCESSSAEPFAEYLLYNDLRFSINLFWGRPVPAYAFIHHEYLHGFMGNQNGNSQAIDLQQSPLNLHQRLAHGFVSGDALTAVIKGGGQIHWEWSSQSWDDPGPNHASAAALIRNLNAWRRGAAHEYLIYGRMIKPAAIEGVYEVPMIRLDGGRLSLPSIFTSCWQAGTRTMQLLVNYTEGAQTCTLACPGRGNTPATEYTRPDAAGQVFQIGADEKLALTLDALSAVMVEW